MEKRKIILDCDPGHDDAIAMMMAAKHPAIELLGITIVAGNQTLDKTLVNGLNVCQKLGIDVPVYAGMPRPIMREQIVAADIHGESGLDGPVFEPLTKKQEPVHAVSYIIDTLMASDGDITLVPVGPLTNIAVAMRMEPAIVSKIREIVLMGGAYGTGNVTPSAEFNVYADPEAARVVPVLYGSLYLLLAGAFHSVFSALPSYGHISHAEHCLLDLLCPVYEHGGERSGQCHQPGRRNFHLGAAPGCV